MMASESRKSPQHDDMWCRWLRTINHPNRSNATTLQHSLTSLTVMLRCDDFREKWANNEKLQKFMWTNILTVRHFSAFYDEPSTTATSTGDFNSLLAASHTVDFCCCWWRWRWWRWNDIDLESEERREKKLSEIMHANDQIWEMYFVPVIRSRASTVAAVSWIYWLLRWLWRDILDSFYPIKCRLDVL